MPDYLRQLNYKSMNAVAGADFGIVSANGRALARIAFIDCEFLLNNNYYK